MPPPLAGPSTAHRRPIDGGRPSELARQALVDASEHRDVRALLEAHGGHVSAAARAAGLGRVSLHKMLDRLDTSAL